MDGIKKNNQSLRKAKRSAAVKQNQEVLNIFPNIFDENSSNTDCNGLCKLITPLLTPEAVGFLERLVIILKDATKQEAIVQERDMLITLTPGIQLLESSIRLALSKANNRKNNFVAELFILIVPENEITEKCTSESFPLARTAIINYITSRKVKDPITRTAYNTIINQRLRTMKLKKFGNKEELDEHYQKKRRSAQLSRERKKQSSVSASAKKPGPAWAMEQDSDDDSTRSTKSNYSVSSRNQDREMDTDKSEAESPKIQKGNRGPSTRNRRKGSNRSDLSDEDEPPVKVPMKNLNKCTDPSPSISTKSKRCSRSQGQDIIALVHSDHEGNKGLSYSTNPMLNKKEKPKSSLPKSVQRQKGKQSSSSSKNKSPTMGIGKERNLSFDNLKHKFEQFMAFQSEAK